MIGTSAVALALAVPASAAAATGAAGAGGAGTGGAGFVPVPEISKVSCLSTCVGKGKARRPRAGGRIRIAGRNLGGATKVTFHGAAGRSDDVSVRVRPRSARRLDVRVPLDARSGPVSVAAQDVRSKRSKAIAILPPPPPLPNAELTPVPGPREPGAPKLETGTTHVKWFFGAERGVSLLYRISDGTAAAVEVQLVRAADGAVVRRWQQQAPEPGKVHRVSWDGRDAKGRVPRDGRYAFRVVAQGASGAVARSASAADIRRDAFDAYGHIFPVRGRHDYGGSGAEFGAGRAGHSHQGHDVFARCGTRLVAARGGVVKFKQYHRAAGHYVVIDGDGTGYDYAYMHLQSASPFKVGDRVYTGQEIGRVGDSGNARGCHLHFEVWGPPGWYDGGSPIDPLPLLKAWDAYS